MEQPELLWAWSLQPEDFSSGSTAPNTLLALHFHKLYTNVGANFVVISGMIETG